MLDLIKKMLGIAEPIKVYDDELEAWISAAVTDATETAGVPAEVFDEDGKGQVDPRAVAAVAMFVKANFGNDRSDSPYYTKCYRGLIRKLQTDEGGAWDE